MSQFDFAGRLAGRRHGQVALMGVLIVGASAFAAPAGAATPPVTPTQRLVKVLEDHAARVSPSPRSHEIEAVPAQRPLTRVRTILPVLGVEVGSDGKSWIHVRLPGRPNGHTGWIRASHTKQVSTGWRLVVKLATRRVTVYQDGRVARRFRAVVGAASTPTPRGRFFIEEAVALPSREPGGPFALATSARSNVLQEFHGGPGQIALHGTRGLPGKLGTASSHGCIRLDTRAITWLAQRIGAGVPLTVGR
jgi:lipoprotein-anchoring transpeptidase ErfK/SrfK